MTYYLDVSAAVHRRAGLGRYAESLARALAERVPERLGLFYNRERGVEPLAGLAHLPARTVALGYKPWRLLVWLGQAARVPFNRLVPGAALFHATEHLLPYLRGVPAVLTVHDLIFRHLPEHHMPLNRWYLNLAMPLFCRRARHIITVSAHTRADLLAAYHVPAERVTVIYEGVSPAYAPDIPPGEVARVRAAYSLPERYLLYLGTVEPRKNLGLLLDAYHALLNRRPDLPRLVIAGRKGWLFEPVFERVRALGLAERVCFTDWVPETDAPPLVAGAEAFVYPSLYEGFGLPPLEAMACGTPVITSTAASLPEVTGDAALHVDPHDAAGLAAAIERLVADPALRADLRARGLARARQFTWEAAARQTLDVYARVTGEVHAHRA